MTDYRDKNIVYKYFNNIFNFDYGTSTQDQIDTTKRTFGIILLGGILAGVAGKALIAGLGPTVGGAIVIATLATVVINLVSLLVKTVMFAMFGDTLKDSNKTAPDNTSRGNTNSHGVQPTTASTLRSNDNNSKNVGGNSKISRSSHKSVRPSSTTSDSSTASTSSSGSSVVSSRDDSDKNCRI